MIKYFVGIGYHEPDSYHMWKKGIIEDYESSTGIFIKARSEEDAINWGGEVAKILFKKVNPEEQDDWESFGHDCWIENENSAWHHCLNFFQTVNYGEMPNFDLMGTEAYSKWLKENKPELYKKLYR